MQVWCQLSSTIVLASCHLTCMTYTVKNSWWWAEELPEKCRFSWEK
jgi:hypothetical protein